MAYAADGYNTKWRSRDGTQPVSIQIYDGEGHCDTRRADVRRRVTRFV
jgi:hypothetical protein